jgi:triosephosphate isomerase
MLMRKPLIAANWKMNKTIDETVEFINSLVPSVQGVTGVEVIVAPPFTSLSVAAELLKGKGIGVAAQNIFYEEKGAFTGEISASMLISTGCRSVIIGHSERRQIFLETDEVVNRKTRIALRNGLEVILCIGETLEEREKNMTFQVLDSQLAGSLNSVNLSGITIAYEPVWAIGTGRTATPEQADEAHTHIREWLRKYGEGADDVRILYGGSVKSDNIESLMEKPDVDGALVGGASLQPDSFAGIIKGAWKK